MSVREKLESRLIKEGTYSRLCDGEGVLRLIEPTLRRGVPLPSSQPDPCELDPGEQCKRGGGGWKEGEGKQREDNISGKQVAVTDRARFHSQRQKKRAHVVTQVCLLTTPAERNIRLHLSILTQKPLFSRLRL